MMRKTQETIEQEFRDCLIASHATGYYTKGGKIKEAYELLKAKIPFDIDIDSCLNIFQHKNLFDIPDNYEEGIVEGLIRIAAISPCDFNIIKTLKRLVDDNYFREIAAIAFMLRSKGSENYNLEEKILFQILYSVEAQNFFRRYLKKEDNDKPPIVFEYQRALYDKIPNRQPLDILVGHFLMMDSASMRLSSLAFYLLSVCNLALFGDPENSLRNQWDHARKLIAELTPEARKAIGEIPTALLDNKQRSDEELIDSLKNMRPFISSCRGVAMQKLSEAILFKDLEAICTAVHLIQLELRLISADFKSDDSQAVCRAINKQYQLIQLQETLIRSSLVSYPNTGHLLLNKYFMTNAWVFVKEADEMAYRVSSAIPDLSGAEQTLEDFFKLLSEDTRRFLQPFLQPSSSQPLTIGSVFNPVTVYDKNYQQELAYSGLRNYGIFFEDLSVEAIKKEAEQVSASSGTAPTVISLS